MNRNQPSLPSPGAAAAHAARCWQRARCTVAAMVPRAAGLALLSGIAACGHYEPPGGGVPKGCHASVELDSPFSWGLGLSSHLDPEAGDSGNPELRAWEDLGVGLVRRDLTWSRVEPERGDFDFSLPDGLMEAVDEAGADLLGLLLYGNPWASNDTDDEMCPPDDPTDFGAYAAELAARYAGRIGRYEIWNEENVGIRFWKPMEDAQAYAELLQVTASMIREVDPEAQVSLGGLFHPDLLVNTPGPEFLLQVAESLPDLAGVVDAVAFHPYRYPFTAPEYQDDSQASLLSDICEMQDLLTDIGAPDLPLWITELGWHTAADALFEGATEEQQAAWLARSALLSFAQGLPVYLWYTYADSGTDTTDQEQMFGLYALDDTSPDGLRAKPAAAAFETLAKLLGAHRVAEDLSQWLGLDADTYAYRFSGGEGELVVAWRSEGEGELLLPGDGSTVLYSQDGSSQELRAEGGAFTLQVGEEPVYLVL